MNKCHLQHLQHDTEIEDALGKSLSAQTVFSLCIKYLKDDLVKVVENRFTGEELTENDIKWVLTVPAIWNDAAKQFMRESAELVCVLLTSHPVVLDRSRDVHLKDKPIVIVNFSEEAEEEEDNAALLEYPLEEFNISLT